MSWLVRFHACLLSSLVHTPPLNNLDLAIFPSLSLPLSLTHSLTHSFIQLTFLLLLLLLSLSLPLCLSVTTLPPLLGPNTPMFLHGISSGCAVAVRALGLWDKRREENPSLPAPSFVASVMLTPGYDTSKVLQSDRFKWPYNPLMNDAVKGHFVGLNEGVLRAHNSTAVDEALAADDLQVRTSMHLFFFIVFFVAFPLSRSASHAAARSISPTISPLLALLIGLPPFPSSPANAGLTPSPSSSFLSYFNDCPDFVCLFTFPSLFLRCFQSFLDAAAPFAGYGTAQEYYNATNPVKDIDRITTPMYVLNSVDDPCCDIGNLFERSSFPHHNNDTYADIVTKSQRAIIAITNVGSHCPFLDGGWTNFLVRDPLFGGWMLNSWADHSIAEYYVAALEVYGDVRKQL